MKVEIARIQVGQRKRKLDEGKVRSLAESFESIGQLQPITVEQCEYGNYRMIAGLHRLEAAKLLGWESIEAQEFEGDAVAAELAEIDENLMRNDLTFLEQGEHLARRQELVGFKQGDNRFTIGRRATVAPLKTTLEIAKDAGISERSAQQRMQVARNIVPEVKDAIRDTEIANSTTQLLELARLAPEKQIEVTKFLSGEMTIERAVREMRRKAAIDNLNNLDSIEVKKLDGVYDVIVIDPPWEMKKIERDVAPNQVEFDYPTMSLDEIKALEVPCADDCHVWLWTTQKYLPEAFDVLKSWGLKYVCTFVWHKPGGFQPFGLPQYNCEFALYARRGTPEFIAFDDFKLCFDAPRGHHSEKPELFYELVRRVTAGRRLDMFSRRAINGFETWGKEAV